jgi:hypothetical protein
MILISHRGNVYGPEPDNENHPDYIMAAYRAGLDVEIDVWCFKEKFFLGHNEPQYLVDWRFVKNPAFWCHAKNLEALAELLKCGAHCFWHQEDDYTLTSAGLIWTYPEKVTCRQSVIVCKTEKETVRMSSKNILGICSDFTGVIK